MTKQPPWIEDDQLTPEQALEENAVLRTALMVIAAAFPTKLILGRTSENLESVIEDVRAGRFVRHVRF